MRHTVIVLVTLAAVSACGKSEGPTPSDKPTTAIAAPATTAKAPLSEEDEVRGVVQIFWPRILEAEAADSKWAGCHDNMHGFDDVWSCLKTTRNAVAAVKAKLPAGELLLHSDCGKLTEKKLRGYIDVLMTHYDELLPWLDKNEARLKNSLRSKSLWNLSSPGQPARTDLGLTSATNERCMIRLLGCKESAFCGAPEMDRIAGIKPR